MPKKIYTERENSKVIAKFRRVGYSIVSGTQNQETVGCRFYALESGECATQFTLSRFHEGHKMLAHGGVTASVLDEAMGYSNHVYEYLNKDYFCFVFTGTATYEYLNPVPIEKEMRAVARVNDDEGRIRHITGEIIDEDGLVYVRSSSVYITAASPEDCHIQVGLLPLEEGDPEML